MRYPLFLVVASALLTGAPTGGVQQQIEAIAARFPGELGVFAKDLQGGTTVAWNADIRFPTASVIKVPVMVEAFEQIARGSLRPDALVRVSDAHRVGGSGVVKELHDGVELTVQDLIRLMIVVSDNTATNVLLERVGTRNVNARMVAYGLRQTRIFRPTFAGAADTDPELEREFGLGMSTPREMATLMEMIADGRAVNPAASKEMLEILGRQQDRQMLARRLPFDRPDVTVANKTGTDAEKQPDPSGVRGHVRADAALVRTSRATWVIAVFARRVKDESWTADNAALLAGAEISRAIFDAWAGRS